jgi:peptidyl-tRNA hydrolase
VRTLSNAYRHYISAFAGFSREIWLLTFATFVNRAGTMVVPFLSLYLTKDMGRCRHSICVPVSPLVCYPRRYPA